MIKHTLEISSEPAHLSIHNSQLILQRNGETIGSIPCEDIGVVLVDHPQATYSHAALAQLAAHDAAVVICGRDHLPVAMLLPLSDHSEVVWRLKDQINASKPLCKQLWKQVVVAKIIAQARILDEKSPAYRKLLDLAQNVRSGDPANVEATAARVYWSHWLKADSSPGENVAAQFRRDQQGAGLNAILNYGYAVLRAGVARAIVAGGLMPSLGIHHQNRSNAFCLADDLMEPLRPIVDWHARLAYQRGHVELTQATKAILLEVLNVRVTFRGQTGPLMPTLHRYVYSLANCFAGNFRQLDFPDFIPVEAGDSCLLTDTDVCGSL